MKNYLLEQFNATYNKKNWFVSLLDAVKDLSEVQAREKVKADVNSIYELVTHLTFWNERYLHKLRNHKLNEVADNDDTFKNEANLHFDQLMAKAEHVFSEWQIELAKPDPFPQGETNDWNSIVGHISSHNAYHIGQIVILRKLQGSWDKAKGVS